MANQNTNDLHTLIIAKDQEFPSAYRSLYDYITSIPDDDESKSTIKSIIENSKQWKHDLAFWCLIDSCHDRFISPLDLAKLRNALYTICESQQQYTTVDIINRVILQQNVNPYPFSIRHLIELFIYLQSGLNAPQLFSLRSGDPSWSIPIIPNTLKVLWMVELIPASKEDWVMKKLEKNLAHPKHFLQCNIEIVQDFVLSIPQPSEINDLISLFDCFTDENNPLTTGSLESFLSDNTGRSLEMCVTQLWVSISLEHLRNKLNPVVIPANILSKIRYSIEKMFLLSWSLHEVCDLLHAVQNLSDLNSMKSVLTIIVEYGLIYDQTIFNIAQRSRAPSQLFEVVHAHALRMSFSADSKMLELDELIDEITKETYPDAQQRETKRKDLSNKYGQLEGNFDRFSSMDREALRDRLASIRQTKDFHAQVAFVIRASDLLLGQKMRIVQKLSVLLALNSSSTTARILQINTGEGKTRIIAVLAVLKCLQGLNVDVITSSKELAKTQSEELKDFYAFFDLKVGCNADLPLKNYTYGRLRKKGNLGATIFKETGVFQPVYECHVIYGSPDDFEGDILRDEFEKNGVRCGRRCEFALVDEVDNMMIDGRQEILHLTSPVPSVFHLLPIKAIIWSQILNLAKMVVKKDDQWYKLGEDENGETVLEVLETSLQKFAQQLILPLVKNFVHLNDTAPDLSSVSLVVPKHLHSFTSKKLGVWIQNAVYAKFEMQEGREYVLKNNKIIYVDVNNTGVLIKKMRWSGGIHCFLEMKHGCSVEPESITTNFISHVAFFRRYSTNLVGLTGTVGAQPTRGVFREVYSADCLIIPPFCERRHHELQARFTSKESDWLQCIVNSCEEKMRQKRAVLIITKFIEQARTIAALLGSNFPRQVKLYTESEEKKFARETLEAGYALVATNIAGRGTDIFVSDEVEQNGGLHVCITFLPDNDRVERQNQGRTSRCGNKGTSQFIINLPESSAHISDENKLLERMREERNQHELTRMKSTIEDVKETIMKDQIFQRFNTWQDEIIECFPANVQDIARKALQEKFGFWLMESSSSTGQALEQSFNKFQSTCKSDTREKLIDNPIYYVQMANSLLKDPEDLDSAIKYLNKAIDMDPHCAASAYFSRGYARALQYKEHRELHRLEDAIGNFEQARRIIKDILDPALMLFPVATENSPLHEYLIHLKTLYGSLTNSINAAIGRPVDEDIAQLKKDLENQDISSEERTEAEEQLQHLESNKNRIENGILRDILKNKGEIKIQHKTLMESLPESEKKDLYKKEIDQLELNGFIGTIIFDERKPIDWWSVISVGALGLCQMVAGVSVAVFSFGAGVGLGLSFLQEGISDLITCVKDGIINRNFSWKQWGIQKTISLAVTIACAGFSALKAAVRTIRGAATTVKNALQHGMKELWTKAVKEGIQIGGKKIALEVVKRVAIEVTLPLVNYALTETIVPVVQNLVQTALSKLIESGHKNDLNLRRLMDCDSKRRNRFFANKLKEKAFAPLREETFQELCKGVGKILLNKASSSIGETATKAGSVALTLVPIIERLGSIVTSFEDEINRLGRSQEVQDILNGINSVNRVSTDERQAESEQLPLTVAEFCSDITEQMSKTICQLIQGMLVAPVLAAGVNRLFADFNQDINAQLGLYHRKRTVAYHQMLTKEEIKQRDNPQTAAAAKQEVNDVRDKAPGRIHHIGFICQAKNRRVRIYDVEGRVEHVIGDDTSQDAIELVHHRSSEPNGIGHWTVRNGKNTQNTGEFNCLFDAIGEQIGCTGEQLRQETVTAMETNINQLAATMHDVQHLEKYHSEALFTGGKKAQPAQNLQNPAGGPNNQSLGGVTFTFEDKHLQDEDSASTNENENQTTIILNGASPRTRNSIIQMKKQAFYEAVAQAKKNQQFTAGRPGEIKITVRGIHLTEMTWQMDGNNRPVKDSNRTFIFNPPTRITADIEVIEKNNQLIHLTVLNSPPPSPRPKTRK